MADCELASDAIVKEWTVMICPASLSSSLIERTFFFAAACKCNGRSLSLRFVIWKTFEEKPIESATNFRSQPEATRRRAQCGPLQLPKFRPPTRYCWKSLLSGLTQAT